MSGMTLNELTEIAHAQSRHQGFWDDAVGISGYPLVRSLVTAAVPGRLALIHSEVSEALEDWRKDPKFPAMELDPDGKPVGFPSELADILIRVGDLAGALGVDLDEAVQAKLAHNRTRPHRHGDVR